MKLSRASLRHTGPSLTPLIDAVFILLLFFLLTARLTSEPGVDLELSGIPPPEATVAPTPVGAARDASVVIDISPEKIVIGTRSVGEDELAGVIATRFDPRARGDVLLHPTSTVSLQRLLTVRDRIRALGVPAERIRIGLPAS